jgi:aminoglycoside 3-N-acetyltransferase I
VAGDYRARRLVPGDEKMARALFALMADAFEEPHHDLSDEYLGQLLARAGFRAIAAFDHDAIVGGLTAHTLPMTRSEAMEVFIYDLAVRSDYRRRGVARQLVAALRAGASEAGAAVIFVPADNEDVDAIAFYRAIGGASQPVTLFTFLGDCER